MNGNVCCFEASGRGAFPHELLANQMCFPASKRDAISAFDYTGSGRTITMKGLEPPSRNLWLSYGWTIRMIPGFGPLNEDYTKYHTWPC